VLVVQGELLGCGEQQLDEKHDLDPDLVGRRIVVREVVQAGVLGLADAVRVPPDDLYPDAEASASR